jgi:alkylation response protein AidB-like acyl-CoA dehydrogenase
MTLAFGSPKPDDHRMLPVFGDYDAPHGHGEVHFNNVRVPIENFIGGAAFEVSAKF